VLDVKYKFFQTADRPTETQFLGGRGQPVKHTGMVKSLFRPSDDATVFPFFIPGNAMLSVELNHISQLLSQSRANQDPQIQNLAHEALRISKSIRDAIYKHGLVNHPTYGKVFACKSYSYSDLVTAC
jgi:meiotically up-regulated gene 157 (Mug157) protein